VNPQDPYQPQQPQQPQQPYQPQPPAYTPPQPSQNGQYNVVPPLVANSATSGHNPYEFIFNSQAQKPSTGSMAKRILMVVIGLALLAIIFAVITSVLSASSNAGQQQLKIITQQQQEILFLATDGAKNLADQSLRNTAATLQFSTTSSQKALLDYAAKNGFTINPDDLALLHDPATDKLLADAKSTSTYDVTWKQTVRTQLEEHTAALKKLYAESTNPDFKQLLQTAYDNALLVNSQLKE
jgi:hypothetical protein